MYSNPSTSKRIKAVSVDDTDSSMKKWITKQNDVFLAQLREDEHYSLRVTPNEKRLGSLIF